MYFPRERERDVRGYSTLHGGWVELSLQQRWICIRSSLLIRSERWIYDT